MSRIIIPWPMFGKKVLWVVDGNHPLIDALTWMDGFSWETTTIFSLDDLIDACDKHVNDTSEPIVYLAVFGHGTGGYQSVGAGERVEDTGTMAILYKGIAPPGGSHLCGAAEEKIRKLNGFLSA